MIDELLNEQRRVMIDLLRYYGIKNDAILAAFEKVERHKYIPEKYRNEFLSAYGDYPVPIGFGQTISQPYIVAYMTEKLDLLPKEKILEVGTGSGYQAAILATLGLKVYSIELIPELGAIAKKNLAEDGFNQDQVKIKIGSGYDGWEEYSPFDAIIITCASERIPEKLVEQLANGGRMILPLGSVHANQKLVIITKKNNIIEKKFDITVRFVPMVE